VTGIEAAFDVTLRGQDVDPLTAWQKQIVHEPAIGHGLRLTLDARLQAAAADVLAGWRGAVVMLDLEGRILVLASSPTFDPNHIDDTFDHLRAAGSSPLLNRATQGLYQPGGILQPVVLAAAIEQAGANPPASWLDRSQTAGNQPVPIRNTFADCAYPVSNPNPSLRAAFAAACPAPFADLGQQLGSAALVDMETRFGLRLAPALPIPTDASHTNPPADDEGARLEAIGQGQLLVSPLQMAWVMATIANQGQQPPLRLVAAIQTAEGWLPPATLGAAVEVIRPDTATTLLNLMAGEPVGFTGHTATALTGPEAQRLTWWIGLHTLPSNTSIAIAVLLEDTGDSNLVTSIARRMMEAADRE
jgi:peptidoglycan glycosyltransferase